MDVDTMRILFYSAYVVTGLACVVFGLLLFSIVRAMRQDRENTGCRPWWEH